MIETDVKQEISVEMIEHTAFIRKRRHTNKKLSNKSSNLLFARTNDENKTNIQIKYDSKEQPNCSNFEMKTDKSQNLK